VLRAWLAGRPAPTGEDRREHFRALTAGLAAWRRGEIDAAETWPAFTERVSTAMEMARPEEGVSLVVSSGGVIAQAVAAATTGLTPPDDAIASGWYRKAVAPVHLRRVLLER